MEDGFGFLSNFPVYLPSITKKIVEITSVYALFGLIQSNFVEFGGRYLKKWQDKSIKLSDIFYMITFYIEDFDNPDNEKIEYDYQYYKEFFEKIHNMYWEDDDAKKLCDDLDSFMGDITLMNKLSFTCQRTFSFATLYVMACNAMKNNQDNINCEDVVIGFITCFKIIRENIKPKVYRLYDETKWLNEDTYL